jgi:hypothetical protein
MNTAVNLLEQIAIVLPDFDIWTAKVQLGDDDIKLGDGGELPPKEFATRGQKYLVNRAELRPFTKLKTATRRICLKYGMPFMNGFAVPLDRIDIVSAALEDVKTEMDDEVRKFLSRYDQVVDAWEAEWASKDPCYARAIREGKLPKKAVEKKLGFDYQLFQVAGANQAQHEKINSMASSLSTDLMDEVVAEASDFFDKNLKDKESIMPASKKVLARLHDKVRGLSFLDSRFNAVLDLLDKAMNGFAAAGGKEVKGENFYRIMAVVLVLASHNKIQGYVDNAINLSEMTQDFWGRSSDSQNMSLVFTEESSSAASHVLPSSVPAKPSPSNIKDLIPDDDELDKFFSSLDDTSSEEEDEFGESSSHEENIEEFEVFSEPKDNFVFDETPKAANAYF